MLLPSQICVIYSLQAGESKECEQKKKGKEKSIRVAHCIVFL